MKCVIDEHSGFCFGVIHAINTVEQYLKEHHRLYCLGDIVHNNEEVKRLTDLGLIIITHKEFSELRDQTVLIRAHGEPPATYEMAKKNNLQIIDATCPVVLNLQKKIRESLTVPDFQDGQILIFGKQGHAEVIGLLGQIEKNGIVISSLQDLDRIDYQRPAKLFSQTTQSLEEYAILIQKIEERYHQLGKKNYFHYEDTICRLVANRSRQIREFAEQYDKIIFVSGEKSSNGLYLFGLCKSVNPNTFFISDLAQLKEISISDDETVGICGATSTPMWLMEKVRERIVRNFS